MGVVVERVRSMGFGKKRNFLSDVGASDLV